MKFLAEDHGERAPPPPPSHLALGASVHEQNGVYDLVPLGLVLADQLHDAVDERLVEAP